VAFSRIAVSAGFTVLALSKYVTILGFIKVGAGVQAILRYFLSNLKGCNVGVTDGWTYDVRRSRRKPVT
jgi:hypothetical protein